jgi:hypothetical protein
MHMFDPLYYLSDLPGFDPATCWGIQENTSPSKRRSLMAFSKYVFQGQEIREYRNSETCEASSSRACRVQETRFGEDVES